MNYMRDILIFVLANLIGFYSAPISYNFAALIGIFSPETIQENAPAFNQAFFSGTVMTWVVCAFISLGFFFAEGKMRKVLIAMPIVVPLIYGFSVLLGNAGAS